MTAPNLRNPSTITGKTAIYSCTTTLSEVLPNPSGSNKVIKINTIRCANVNASLTATVDVTIYRSSVHKYLIKTVQIPATKSLIVTDKNEYIYLEEGDSVYALSGTSGDIDMTITYEDIS